MEALTGLSNEGNRKMWWRVARLTDRIHPRLSLKKRISKKRRDEIIRERSRFARIIRAERREAAHMSVHHEVTGAAHRSAA
ncbi:MAG: hypothetical protein AAB573_02070 [Patescibacteria group bacterium]